MQPPHVGAELRHVGLGQAAIGRADPVEGVGRRTVGDILAVQDRLAAANTKVDQLQGQINVLNNQASLSSIAVTLSENVPKQAAATVASEDAERKSGFMSPPAVDGLWPSRPRIFRCLAAGSKLRIGIRRGWSSSSGPTPTARARRGTDSGSPRCRCGGLAGRSGSPRATSAA